MKITLTPQSGSIIIAPPVPVGARLVLPVAGPPGRDGAPGAPGQLDLDIPDLTLLLENGLI